jgi:hypothetical protein
MKVRLIANGVNLVACNYDKFAIENNSLPTVVWTNTVYVFIIAHHGLKPTIMRPLISESTERPNSNQSKQKAIPSFNWRHYMWDTGRMYSCRRKWRKSEPKNHSECKEQV